MAPTKRQISGNDNINLSYEEEREMDMAINKIRLLWHCRVPFFTRQLLEQIAFQLDEYAQGILSDTFIVIGIDGQTSAVPVPRRENGRLPSQDRPKLQVDYLSIQRLQDSYCLGALNSGSGLKNFTLHFKDNILGPDTDACKFSKTALARIFRLERVAWTTSRAFLELSAIVQENQRLWTAGKIVGIGLGPLVRGSRVDDVGNQRSLTRYSFLHALREMIAALTGHTRPCIAQDPELSPTAAGILEDAGVTVMEDPRGFLEIDQSTILVSIDPKMPVKQIVSEIARPLAIIWAPGSVHSERGSMFPDMSSTRVDAMLHAEYINIGFLMHPSLQIVSIYLRVG
ncbi:hypothetical protein F4802DRAFT_618538 [Xylaria palmicola]|nr:hypothetical protein F4802DRAFT_618538 [Xylaria palmicola]